MFITGIVLGLVLCALAAATQCYFRVEQGHLAVLSSFGAAQHRRDDPARLRTYGPGAHFKRPWERVHDVAMMERNLELSGEKGGQSAMAEDGTVLRFDSILRYEPVEAELGRLLFELESPVEHITGLFTCLLRNEIANFGQRAAARAGDDPGIVVADAAAATGSPSSAALARLSERPSDPAEVGSYALIRRERRLLNARIEAFCRAEIGERYGVRFNAVDLSDILPPDELADALNAVMNARTEAEAHYARAEADCEQRVLAAERGVEIAAARAQASETEIRRLGEYLAKLDAQGTLAPYIARRRAEVLAESRSVYYRSST